MTKLLILLLGCLHDLTTKQQLNINYINFMEQTKYSLRLCTNLVRIIHKAAAVVQHPEFLNPYIRYLNSICFQIQMSPLFFSWLDEVSLASIPVWHLFQRTIGINVPVLWGHISLRIYQSEAHREKKKNHSLICNYNS